MIKNILLLALITSIPLCAFAEDVFYTANPKAKGGITIVPLSEMNPSKEMVLSLEQQKTKGYFEKDSNDAREMLKTGKNFKSEINDTSDPTDTHMKSSLSKIKLAFEFMQIPFITPIGFAVGGTYLKGWTAISTFFNQKNLGTCSFTLNNMKLNNGAVRIAKEAVRYDINNKVTNIFVEGSANSGFMYNINWNDDTFNYMLACANMNFDNTISIEMSKLAKKIDTEVNLKN